MLDKVKKEHGNRGGDEGSIVVDAMLPNRDLITGKFLFFTGILGE